MQYDAARENMINGQLKPNHVNTPAILSAFRAIPRGDFVPKAALSLSYADEMIEVSGGRFMLSPMVLGRMIEILAPREDDLALVVGALNGYSTAVISQLVSAVVALESEGALMMQIDLMMSKLEIPNVVAVPGDLAAGHSEQAPYDIILVEGAVTDLAKAWGDQLAEGGRMVFLQQAENEVAQVMLAQKIHGTLAIRPVFDAAAFYLPGFEPKPAFRFA